MSVEDYSAIDSGLEPSNDEEPGLRNSKSLICIVNVD
jgi:hypothetical protein